MPQTAQSGSTPHRAGAHTASLPERVKPSHASHRPRSRARHCPLVTEVTGEAPHRALPGVRAMGYGATHTEITLCCSGSLSLCDSNPRTHRGRIRLKAQGLRELLPPIPILPAPILPQEVDPVLGPPDFQTLDRFIARHLLAAEGHIEVDLATEEPQTALGGDPFLHHRIPGVLF